MASKLKTFFAIAFTVFLLSVSTFACTCGYEPIKTKGFIGQVFALRKSEPNYKEPLPKATLKLLKRADESEVVAEIVADENGRFVLENIKPGKYVLRANASGFEGIYVWLTVSKTSNRQRNNLDIGLALGGTCCEGYAKVQKAKKSS